MLTLLKMFVLYNFFFVNLFKKIVRFFFTISFKNLNWQVILLWVIIIYKIIKFVSIFTKFVVKSIYTKYFEKKMRTILYKLFFITKFINIFYEKNFKNKTNRKYEFVLLM